MKPQRILITGSNGTIGTRLCETLLAEGHLVTGIDYRPNQWSSAVASITHNIDLRDKHSLLYELPGNFDLVIHLAANARVHNLVLNPSLARDNFETLFNILEYTRLHNIKKFIFSSSREVYGNTATIIHKETDADVFNCESAYTASKIGGEALIHSYRKCYDMDAVIFRFSNVYGMYDDSDRIIPIFINRCCKGQDLTVFGLYKLLDFTYIDDTVNGIIQGIENFDHIRNDVYNLASGQGVSIIKVASLLKKLIPSDNKIIIRGNRTGEVIKYIADISKARQLFNYVPTTDIEKGIRQTVNWYLTHMFRIVPQPENIQQYSEEVVL